MKDNVAIGMIGAASDGPRHESRWGRWRPTLGLMQQKDLSFVRADLIYDENYASLAEIVKSDVERVAPQTEVVLHRINFGDINNFETVYEKLLDFTERYPFNESREEYFIHLTTASHAALVSLFLLARARFLPGQLVQTSPPFEALGEDKSGTHSIVDLNFNRNHSLSSKMDRIALDAEDHLKGGLEIKNTAYSEMIAEVAKTAISGKDSILIKGAEGVGKTFLAERIYELKKRRNITTGEFITIMGSTIRSDNFEELFLGNSNGAVGYFQQAQAGTIFIDNVEEMPKEAQALLAQTLKCRQFRPANTKSFERVNFEVMVGTSADLARRVAQKNFRADLYSLIAGISFEIAPLKERTEDIEAYIDQALEKIQKSDKLKVHFEPDARALYLSFARDGAQWQGNLRELQKSVERLVRAREDGVISNHDVEREIETLKSTWKSRPEFEEEALIEKWVKRPIDEFERIQLAYVLRICLRSKSLSDAGRKLYAISREHKKASNDADRLRKYLQKFGIEWKQIKEVQQSLTRLQNV